jgi:predicted mannosyl-3-phosphoglycerate phosphatase (HAD superfamily)
MKKLLFFDIDGTLWDNRSRIPESTVRAIRRARENGHLAFINSGRSDIKASQAGVFFCYGNFFGSSFDVRKTAKLIEENGAHIIANPCRESAEKLYGSEYWIDPALSTEILITEAGELLISPVAFTGEKIRIDVVKLAEDDVALQGTWTFGG